MNNINYKLLGKRVREKRKEQHFSQEELAFEAGISNTYISNIETGRKKASLETLVAISTVFEITLDELLSGNQYNNPSDYQTDIDALMEDCTNNEKRFIYELLRSSKQILRSNQWQLMEIEDTNHNTK
ncbi:MAG: helix-turn-helix domain-containing protein [Anaerovoracaceae bacterium]|jgi:transcriptional regulator with XRE-family HTH domain